MHSILLGEHCPLQEKLHHLLVDCYNRKAEAAWSPTDLTQITVKKLLRVSVVAYSALSMSVDRAALGYYLAGKDASSVVVEYDRYTLTCWTRLVAE